MSEDLDGGSSRVYDIYLCLECWGYMINPSSAIGSTTFQQKGRTNYADNCSRLLVAFGLPPFLFCIKKISEFFKAKANHFFMFVIFNKHFIV